MTAPKTTPGEAAYLASCDVLGLEKHWPDLSDWHKRAWEAAAKAAIATVRLDGKPWATSGKQIVRLTEDFPPNTPNGRRVGVSR